MLHKSGAAAQPFRDTSPHLQGYHRDLCLLPLDALPDRLCVIISPLPVAALFLIDQRIVIRIRDRGVVRVHCRVG
ncbi:hypothetical protein N805_04160 [Pseudomonas putida S13.1.2]|uniref:Lipoprotein n=1 Tax=Pseudomonas putida S13.1.2 TaxID=1384061 RepID=A0AAU8S132_PSEPU|nr:hypothetical protein N805_04160 [Pseudomonas putida S13.1.2]